MTSIQDNTSDSSLRAVTHDTSLPRGQVSSTTPVKQASNKPTLLGGFITSEPAQRSHRPPNQGGSRPLATRPGGSLLGGVERAWPQREPCGSGGTDPKDTGLRSVTMRQGEGGDKKPEAVQKDAALKEGEADQRPMASRVPEGIQGAGPRSTPPPA